MIAVALVYSSRDLGTYPAIMNWVRLLAERGWDIHIYANECMRTQEMLPRTRYFWLPDDKYPFYQELQQHLNSIRAGITWIVAFQLEGLLAASEYRRTTDKHIRVAYVSMELTYRDYIRRSYACPDFILYTLAGVARIALGRVTFCDWWRSLLVVFRESREWKYLHRLGSSFVLLAVAQDTARERLLLEEFPFLSDTRLIPNGYLDYDESISTWGHEYFGLPQSAKLVLYAGMLEEGFDVKLLSSLQELPDGYVVILNAYSRDGYLDRIDSLLSPLVESGKVVVHRHLLREEDYDALVRSCWVGLVWYSPPNPSDHNMFYMGLSSGKLCKYLSRGKPVIAQRGYHGYEDLIDGHGIGITCESAHDLPKALETVEEQYLKMQHAVREFAALRLDMRKAFAPILERLEML